MAHSFGSIAVLSSSVLDGFTAGARRTVRLDTEDYDADGIASLASNQVTLAAGTYEALWYVTTIDVNSMQSWLHNATDTTDISIGDTSEANDVDADGSYSHGRAIFTLGSSKAIEVQAQCQTTEASANLGCVLLIREVGTAVFSDSFAILSRQETSGTAGGSLSANTWTTTPLNTEDYDPDGIVTLASNQFTLGAGTYEIIALASIYNGAGCQNRIYNASDSSVEFSGLYLIYPSTYARESNNDAVAIGVVTLASTKTLEMQSWCLDGRSSNGMGQPSSFDTEQYALVYIRKIA